MAQKNMKQIIDQLRSSGYQVNAYKRKDGGYLIRSINGAKFTGAKGNEAARQIVGASLSVRKQKQLKAITPSTKKAAKIRRQGRLKLEPIPADITKQIKKVQKMMRENVSALGTRATITTGSIRKIIKEEGEQAARTALQKAQSYAAGIAYDENVRLLAERFNSFGNKTGITTFNEIASTILSKIGTFKEEWIPLCYEAIYNYEKIYYTLSANAKNAEAEKVKNTIYSVIGG